MTPADQSKSGRRRAILITGMHRSGTSALTRIINLHGAAIGGELLEANGSNETGYWENKRVVLFHEKVLRELNLAWDSPASVATAVWKDARYAPYVKELSDLIEDEYAREPLLVIKDPRLCKLVPLWRAALEQLSMDAKFVFEVRHPDEVVRSLVKRDGLGPALASFMWMEHLRLPMMETEGCSRVLVVYDDVLLDWRTVIGKLARELDIVWPVPSEACAPEVDAFIRPSMRHHRSEQGAGLVPMLWRKSLVDIFEVCCQVSRSVANWSDLVRHIGGAMEVMRLVVPLAQDVSSPSQLSREKDLAMEFKMAADRAAADLAVQNMEFSALNKEFASINLQFANTYQQLVVSNERLETADRQLAASQRQLASTNQQLAVSNERLETADRQLALLTEEMASAKDDLVSSKALLSEAHSRLLELERSLASKKATIAQLEAAGRLAQERGDRLLAERDQLRSQLTDILRSHSWKLTRPLRLLVRLVRGDVGYIRHAMQDWTERKRHSVVGVVGSSLPVVAKKRLADSVRPLRFAQPGSPIARIWLVGAKSSESVGQTLVALSTLAVVQRCEVHVHPGQLAGKDLDTLARVHGIQVTTALPPTVTECPLLLVRAGVLIADGCIEAMLETMQREPGCTMVGPMVMAPTGLVLEAGTIVWSDGSNTMFGRNLPADDYRISYVRDVDACGDGAAMLRVDSLQRASLLIPGHLAERNGWLDLAFVMSESGARVLYQPRAKVVDGRDVAEQSTLASGRADFSARWGKRLAKDHLDVSAGDLQARERSQLTKTILVVDHSVPQPDRDAGSRSMWHFMQMFKHRGFTIKFWPHNQWRDTTYVDQLQQEGIEVVLDHEGGFPAWIAASGRTLDAVLLSRPHVALEYIGAIREIPSLDILYYGHDIHYLRLQAQAKHHPGQEIEQEAARNQSWEQAIWPAVDAIYYPAEGESEYVRNWLARNGHAAIPVRTIPVYAFDSFPVAPHANLAERRDLMFVGGFAHAPNADAAEWFAREVMPLVHASRPDVRLHLLGSNPSPQLRDLANDHIEVVGYVSESDLLDWYLKIRVSLAPLRFGAGMKGKVVEALRYGVPCAMTSIGAQGLEDVDFLQVADTPQDFAQNVLKLLDDDAHWLSVSLNQQTLARSRFSEEALWQVVKRDIGHAVQPSAASVELHAAGETGGVDFSRV